MYVAVKGGEKAIKNAHDWLSQIRRGNTKISEIRINQLSEQLTLSVDRIISEGSLYDRELAALALKQSRGDLIEAIFLIRAFRTTLPRLATSKPINSSKMICKRRISATFKDIPGGQNLGPTFDYTHRLLDGLKGPKNLVMDTETDRAEDLDMPKILDLLNKEGLIEDQIDTLEEPIDITRSSIQYPTTRAARLQALSRADEGFLLGLAYSTQRGYGGTHAFIGELRIGLVAVNVEIPELEITITVAEIEVTECETINQFTGSKTELAKFTRGYGLVMGQCERKAISMALVDRALRWKELGESYQNVPTQNEEFVISHCDNIQSTGFVEHIKLPHYVDFQSELELVRKIRSQQMKD